MTDTTATVHQAVTIDVPAAALLVTASDRADVDVTIEPSNPDRGADREAAERITVTETENGIAVTGEKRLLLGANGSADVRLAVPAGTDLEATISAGAVRSRGHLGAVRLKISAGDVTGDTMVSIRAKVSHGSIALAEVADGADLQLSSGEAEIGRIGGRRDQDQVGTRFDPHRRLRRFRRTHHRDRRHRPRRGRRRRLGDLGARHRAGQPCPRRPSRARLELRRHRRRRGTGSTGVDRRRLEAGCRAHRPRIRRRPARR
ncbi:hypothetical protein IOD13_18875 [Brevibacterium casei]|nr:hypothetical protein [Brevibacterium casei]